MSTVVIDTSVAKEVKINIWDIDSIPVVNNYSSEGSPIDLSTYDFAFKLMRGKEMVKEYLLPAASESSEFLSKSGGTINLRLMFEDIRVAVMPGNDYRLLQIVAHSGNTFVHLVYIIDARRH